MHSIHGINVYTYTHTQSWPYTYMTDMDDYQNLKQTSASNKLVDFMTYF